MFILFAACRDQIADQNSSAALNAWLNQASYNPRDGPGIQPDVKDAHILEEGGKTFLVFDVDRQPGGDDGSIQISFAQHTMPKQTESGGAVTRDLRLIWDCAADCCDFL